MCLERVTEVYDKPSSLVVSGWKYFRGTTDQPTSENYGDVYPLDKWIKAVDKVGAPIKASDGNQYRVGFHVFADEKEAKKDRCRQIFVRNVTCLGTDRSKKTMIAQEMYIPSDPNGWPPKNKSVLERAKGMIAGEA